MNKYNVSDRAQSVPKHAEMRCYLCIHHIRSINTCMETNAKVKSRELFRANQSATDTEMGTHEVPKGGWVVFAVPASF